MTTEEDHLPDIPRLIEPEEINYAKGTGSEYRELDLLESDLKLHITHQPDDKTAIVLERDGEESCSLIADSDDKISINTPE